MLQDAVVRGKLEDISERIKKSKRRYLHSRQFEREVRNIIDSLYNLQENTNLKALEELPEKLDVRWFEESFRQEFFRRIRGIEFDDDLPHHLVSEEDFDDDEIEECRKAAAQELQKELDKCERIIRNALEELDIKQTMVETKKEKTRKKRKEIQEEIPLIVSTKKEEKKSVSTKQERPKDRPWTLNLPIIKRSLSTDEFLIFILGLIVGSVMGFILGILFT